MKVIGDLTHFIIIILGSASPTHHPLLIEKEGEKNPNSEFPLGS